MDTTTPTATPAPALTTERKKLCHSIFVTALEGGIGYWSRCSHYHWSKPGTGPESFEGRVDDLDGFYAIVHADCDDADCTGSGECDEHGKHRIDAEVIDRGINRLANGEATFGGKPINGEGRLYTLACALNGPKADEVDYDASDADNIVQAGLFNDIVYG
jgi:hypothetical protein